MKLNIEIDCDLFTLLQEMRIASEQVDNAYKFSLCLALSERLQGKILPGCYDPFSLAQKESLEQLWEQLSLWTAAYCWDHEQYAEAARFLQSDMLPLR